MSHRLRQFLAFCLLLLCIAAWSDDEDLDLWDEGDEDVLGELNEMTRKKPDFAGLQNSCCVPITSWHLVRPRRLPRNAKPKTYHWQARGETAMPLSRKPMETAGSLIMQR